MRIVNTVAAMRLLMMMGVLGNDGIKGLWSEIETCDKIYSRDSFVSLDPLCFGTTKLGGTRIVIYISSMLLTS